MVYHTLVISWQKQWQEAQQEAAIPYPPPPPPTVSLLRNAGFTIRHTAVLCYCCCSVWRRARPKIAAQLCRRSLWSGLEVISMITMTVGWTAADPTWVWSSKCFLILISTWIKWTAVVSSTEISLFFFLSIFFFSKCSVGNNVVHFKAVSFFCELDQDNPRPGVDIGGLKSRWRCPRRQQEKVRV